MTPCHSGSTAKRVEYVAEVSQRAAAVVQHQAVGPVVSRVEGHYHATHREIPSCWADYDDPDASLFLGVVQDLRRIRGP